MELKGKIKQFCEKNKVFTTPEIDEYLSKTRYKKYYTRNEIAQKTRAFATFRKGTWETKQPTLKPKD
jgi:hypothetical protein